MAMSGVGSEAEKVDCGSGAWCSQRQGDVAGTGPPCSVAAARREQRLARRGDLQPAKAVLYIEG